MLDVNSIDIKIMHCRPSHIELFIPRMTTSNTQGTGHRAAPHTTTTDATTTTSHSHSGLVSIFSDAAAINHPNHQIFPRLIQNIFSF